MSGGGSCCDPRLDLAGEFTRNGSMALDAEARQGHGNQYGSAHCLLLPREDVEGGSSEAEQCDSR
jgi:hypothetical protein